VLLSKGAKKVFGVDVGSNQMHERIKTDERVINLEKTHARDLTEKQITEEIDGLVVDVSFISLEKVIPFVIRFLKPNADVVLLIKPQFELGRAFLSKGGIVKDVRQYPILLETIKSMCERNQLEWQAYIDSPILGGDGNKEFLGYFKRK
jgi:23S rRNA (cytidine1920-2'-O)/16S rRNA (cytidine1409-2'-O)-methyltransferase